MHSNEEDTLSDRFLRDSTKRNCLCCEICSPYRAQLTLFNVQSLFNITPFDVVQGKNST